MKVHDKTSHQKMSQIKICSPNPILIKENIFHKYSTSSGPLLVLQTQKMRKYISKHCKIKSEI